MKRVILLSTLSLCVVLGAINIANADTQKDVTEKNKPQIDTMDERCKCKKPPHPNFEEGGCKGKKLTVEEYKKSFKDHKGKCMHHGPTLAEILDEEGITLKEYKERVAKKIKVKAKQKGLTVDEYKMLIALRINCHVKHFEMSDKELEEILTIKGLTMKEYKTYITKHPSAKVKNYIDPN